MRKLLLSLTLLCTAGGLMGRDITGVVTDSKGALPGVDVVVQGSDEYEITDENGKFSISAETGDVLEISFMGYETKTVKIDSKSNYTIKLSQEVEDLGTVTVTGDYGKVKKEDLTGSTAQIGGEKLTSAPTASVENALAGKVSGLRVSSSSGQPGQASTVQIRGLGSLTGSNEPLYVVDGMPINGGGKTSSNDNPLASINSNDILTMEVLKDASATAIYGARAANGVVMITTKRGKNTKEENRESALISYAGQFSVSSITDKLDLMDLQEFASYYTDPYIAAAYNQSVDKEMVALAKFGGKGTDWQDEMFRTAISHSHQVSLTGGTDKTQYALSLGYMNQDGILVNTDFERFNGRLNLESQVKSWLRVGLNLAYTHMTQTKQSGFDFPDDNKLSGIGSGNANEEAVYVQSLISSPATSPLDFNGGYTELGSADQEIKMNPLREANYSPIFLNKNNVTGQTFIAFNITKDLNWRNSFGFDQSTSGENRYKPSEGLGTNQQEFIDRKNMYYRFCSTLNYNLPQPKESKHKMNALLGYEAWKATWEGTSTRKSNYLDDLKFIDPQYQNTNLGDKEGPISGYKGAQSMMSTFARVNYTFNRRYLVTATGRFDGSSTLAPENRWGFFPSFSLAWNADQELFMKRITSKKKITQLKLRAGWGQTGNAGNNMGYIGSYKSVNTQNGMGKIYGTWLNPDLIWETNWQINAGIDASFLNNRLNLTFDAFYKQNNDLIVKAEPGPTLASTVNSYLYTNVPDINAGSIKNVGFDVTLTSTNIQKEDLGGKPFSWNTDFNFSFVRNEVVELQNDSSVLEGKQSFKTSTRTYCVSRVGHAPGLFWGFKTDGLIQNTKQLGELVRADATDVGDFNFVDINSDGIINEADKTYIGDPNPDFTFGLGNTFNWGPWSLNIFLNGSYGNDVYNLLRSKLEGMDRGGINQLKTVLNCARVETTTDENGQTYKYISNSSTNIPRPNSVAEGRNVANVVSDRYVEDASYIRIQSIGISYSVPNEAVKKIGLNSMRVSFNVQNVATFTSYSGLNPEVPNVSAINQGVDTGSYPLSRSYVVGLNFDF